MTRQADTIYGNDDDWKISGRKLKTPSRHLIENVKWAFTCMDLVFRGGDEAECQQLT